MTPAIDPPAAALSPLIDEVRSIASAPEQSVEVGRLPDGRTNLVVRQLEAGPTEVWVAGPNTRAVFKRKSGVARTTIFQFKPTRAVALLGVSASELTNRVVLLSGLPGAWGRELSEELTAIRSHREAVDCVSWALAHRGGRGPATASSWLARRAVRLIEGGESRVERVAAQLGVTSRHLRRAFVENIGIAPKEFARTVRLGRALRLATTSRDWARVAEGAGYYDQAHLIGDFRGLIGLTPNAFLAWAHSHQALGGGGSNAVWSVVKPAPLPGPSLAAPSS